MKSIILVLVIGVTAQIAYGVDLTTLPEIPNPTKIAGTRSFSYTDKLMGIRDQGTCKSAYAETVATVLEYKNDNQIQLSSDSLVNTCMPEVQSISLVASLIQAQVKGLQPMKLLLRSASQSTAPVKGNPCSKQLDGDETALKNHLKENGPGIVMIDPSCVRSYEYGVINKTSSDTTVNGYPMVLVGAGHSSMFGDFFSVRNSEGLEWGENGHMRIKAGSNNCGIANVFISFCE